MADRRSGEPDLGHEASEMIPEISVEPLAGYSPRLGAALWRLEDTRKRTLVALEGLQADEIDAIPDGFDNSIGTLLYHLAVVEADWLYTDILNEDFPEWVGDLFPHDGQERDGTLAHLTGIELEAHLARLIEVRGHLLRELGRIDDDSLDQTRPVAEHLVSPAWVLHHLSQHEAEHRGQLQSIRTALRNR